MPLTFWIIATQTSKRAKFLPSVCEWDNTVTIKLDASDDSDKEYKKKFGVNFMDEDTLIIGDDMNNVLMVYQDENKVITEDITSLIHVLNKLRLTPQCIIHKRVEPSKAPPHIKIDLNFVQNNIQICKHYSKCTTLSKIIFQIYTYHQR